MGGIPWTAEEDQLLRKCIEKYGEGKWHQIPHLAETGLNRCRKSCRLRWLNYLRPNIKRGSFEQEEVEVIINLQRVLGNKWSLVAARLPGRTGNDVKNYWNCHLSKKLSAQETHIFKPQQSKYEGSKLKRPMLSSAHADQEKIGEVCVEQEGNNLCVKEDHDGKNDFIGDLGMAGFDQFEPVIEQYDQEVNNTNNKWEWDDSIFDMDHLISKSSLLISDCGMFLGFY